MDVFAVSQDEQQLKKLQQSLLMWFQQSARDLPWRHTRNPYHILVSEMMLQQTQVDRVISHYYRFLEIFPTLADLATAPTAEIIRQWSGLGYNRRAIYLQNIARIILTEYNGAFPATVADLQRLPGIGPYTAGALACFAFGQDVAFMDTNIRRVIQRLFIGAEDSVHMPSNRVLLKLAEDIIPHTQGWSWNQALMELGALICTARTPDCSHCPVQHICRAYAMWYQEKDHAKNNKETMVYANVLQTQQPIRRVAERKAPFIGSNRYYRGRIITVLRTLSPSALLSLEQLGSEVKDDFDTQDNAWLQGLIDDLIRDGLVEQIDEGIRLPA